MWLRAEVDVVKVEKCKGSDGSRKVRARWARAWRDGDLRFSLIDWVALGYRTDGILDSGMKEIE